MMLAEHRAMIYVVGGAGTLLLINLLRSLQARLSRRSGLFKRQPSMHQKQMRFFLVMFGFLTIALFIGFLILMNEEVRPSP
jgi:hypothetical protein